MALTKKRIRRIAPYARLLPPGADIIVGITNPSEDALRQIGFSEDLVPGETILPSPVGKHTMHNAEGTALPDKSQPLETAYRTVEWHWSEWHGHDRIERTRYVDVPYKRYPRKYIAPPSIELTLSTDPQGDRVVHTSVIKDWRNAEPLLVHVVNMFFEMFGVCSFYDGERNPIISAPVRRLNWRVLPPGRHPFPSIKAELLDALSKAPEQKRVLAEHRVAIVNKHEPEFAAVGEGGFRGYVVFGFPAQNLYILESVLYGNATYVFEEQWEKLSRMTKAEILSEGLHKERFVHNVGWDDEINNLLS